MFFLFLYNVRFRVPEVPHMGLSYMLLNDAIPISIVTFALNLSIAKKYAAKHRYTVKANQVSFLLNYQS